MVKAILFDYGGVMTAGGGGNELSVRLAANLGISDEEAWELLMPLWGKYVRAKITEDELWQLIEEQLGRPVPEEQRDIWSHWQHVKPLPEMVEFVRELRAQGIQVGLLTTVVANTAEEINAHDGYAPFDFCILSYQTGVAKPESEAYKQAFKQLKGDVWPDEVVVIDDQEVCLEPAADLGMQTVLFENADQAMADVNHLVEA